MISSELNGSAFGMRHSTKTVGILCARLRAMSLLQVDQFGFGQDLTSHGSLGKASQNERNMRMYSHGQNTKQQSQLPLPRTDVFIGNLLA